MIKRMLLFPWKVLKFLFFYILIGPITLVLYVAKWIFKR